MGIILGSLLFWECMYCILSFFFYRHKVTPHLEETLFVNLQKKRNKEWERLCHIYNEEAATPWHGNHGKNNSVFGGQSLIGG
jgi:hypothetical protein